MKIKIDVERNKQLIYSLMARLKEKKILDPDDLIDILFNDVK